MKLLLGFFGFTLILFSNSRAFADSENLTRCKKNKAQAYLPFLQGSLSLKSDGAALKAKIPGLNTDLFCECLFKKVPSLDQPIIIDKTKKVDIEELTRAQKNKDAAMYACFGEQIGNPNLQQPQPQEIVNQANQFKPPAEQQNIQSTKAKLSKLSTSIQVFKMQLNRWPANLNELISEKVLSNKENFKDSWGQDIELINSNQLVELKSRGPDKTPGTADDLTQKIPIH